MIEQVFKWMCCVYAICLHGVAKHCIYNRLYYSTKSFTVKHARETVRY